MSRAVRSSKEARQTLVQLEETTWSVELKRAGKPIPINDAWIAALARQHSRPVLSNDSHFDAVPDIERIPF